MLEIIKDSGAIFPRDAWGVVSQASDEPNTEELKIIVPYDQEAVAEGLVDSLEQGVDVLSDHELSSGESEEIRNLSWSSRRLILQHVEDDGRVAKAYYADNYLDTLEHPQVAA